MKGLQVSVYKSGQDTPEKIICMPITSLHFAVTLLPKKIKSSLEREGIDLTRCSELTKEKDLKGTLIEIENPNEKLVIGIE